jgi:hypothetical protein
VPNLGREFGAPNSLEVQNQSRQLVSKITVEVESVERGFDTCHERFGFRQRAGAYKLRRNLVGMWEPRRGYEWLLFDPGSENNKKFIVPITRTVRD